MSSTKKENLTQAVFSEYTFKDAKFSPSLIIRVLNERKLEGTLSKLELSESVSFFFISIHFHAMQVFASSKSVVLHFRFVNFV